MKEKHIYFRRASVMAFFFVLLGYMVKFYPEQVVVFDEGVQTAVRGELPPLATAFWTKITVLGNFPVVLALTVCAAFLCWRRRWTAESLFLLVSFGVMGVASIAFKYLYQRPRPSIPWLVDTIGYSFPSWHAASTMILAGALVIIMRQRMKQTWIKVWAQVGILFVAVLVALSRIYVGVHYPTDIVGGWFLAVILLVALYPFYDTIRFRWRFQSKQN